jgi:hypothetical protein
MCYHRTQEAAQQANWPIARAEAEAKWASAIGEMDKDAKKATIEAAVAAVRGLGLNK